MRLPTPALAAVSVIPLAAVAAGRRLYQPSCWLLGWSVIEPTGVAAASALFYEGADATGEIRAGLSIPIAGDSSHTFGPYGVPCAGGLYLAVLSGQVTGAVWVGTE